MAENLKKHHNFFLTEGIFALVIGILMLVLPAVSSIAIGVIVSVGLILVGIHKLISAIVRRKETGKAWIQMLIAVILIGTGIYMTMNPMFNLLVLTIGIALYLIFEGISSMSIAIEERRILKYWWMGIVAAIVQFFLAFLIIYMLPAAAILTIGILVGINLIFTGISLISFYAGTKELAFY